MSVQDVKMAKGTRLNLNSLEERVVPAKLAPAVTDGPPAVTAEGNGLGATYYDNKDFTGPTAARTDAAIDFNWGYGSPAVGIGADTFSVRWAGSIQVPVSGDYVFRTYSDDGVRVKVNGRVVLDQWNNHAARYDQSAPVTLTVGQRVSIEVEYYENGGKAVARLEWRKPGDAAFEGVPQRFLYSDAVPPPPPPANRPPVAANDAASTAAGAAVTVDVLKNDADPDGDALNVSAVGTPANGTADVSNGKVVYTPKAGFSGTDTFTYTASDGKGGTASAQVTVTVAPPVPPPPPPPPANRSPVAANDTASTAAGTAVTVDVLKNDSDPDGDALTISSVGTPANGTAAVSSGKVVYTPTAGFSGTDTFTYAVADGRGGTATAQVSVTVAPPTPVPAGPFTPLASSYLGGAASDDGVRGTAIRADGTTVLGAVIGDANPGGVTPILLNGATAQSRGAVVRLSGDGRTVLSVTRVAANISDMSTDAQGNIYLATGAGGVVKLDPTASVVLWTKAGRADRIDAAPSGIVAALGGSGFAANGTGFTNAGTVTVYDPAGTVLGSFGSHGGRGTYDVAVDDATRSVFTTGFRQTNGPSGNPVQISYLRSQWYDGTQKWKAYDWTAAQVDDPRQGGTGPTNNMADTRGLRLDMGADGKLYVAYQAAGGNHIFRYDPFDINKPAPIVGGDKYHQFYNTKSEHKTVFAKYDPATGAVLLQQQLVNRLTAGGGNSINLNAGGDIQADEQGRVYLTGASASGMPVTFEPLAPGSYTGGAFLYVMSADFKTRLLVTRVGGGSGLSVAARTLPGESQTRLVYGGRTDANPIWTDNPVQSQFGGGTSDGFFAVFGPKELDL
ncbi:Ig-like domain-containing protein [Gemmata sp.]|uniref:Ig-like domain-containing protein n=1 Tax=Gemmata sp. TaxID=1914242 RepID=UPI003F6EED9A